MSYQHGEAFCLMKYTNEQTGEVEWLWNSRDRVTPFTIAARGRGPAPITDKTAFLSHADWNEDVRIPNFVPPVGMRIFVDMTRERAEEHARRFFGKHGEAMMEQYPHLREMGEAKLIAAKIDECMGPEGKGAPDIVEVTPELQAVFQERAAAAHRKQELLRRSQACQVG